MKERNFFFKVGYLFFKPIKFLKLDLNLQITISIMVLGILTVFNSLAAFYLEKPSTNANDFASKLAVNPVFGAATDVLLAFISLLVTSFIYYLALKYIFKIGIEYKQSTLLIALISIPSIIKNIWDNIYKMYTGNSMNYNYQGTFIHQASVYVNIFVLWEAILFFLFLKYYMHQSNKKSAILTIIFVTIPIIIHIVVL
ncbi:YIP1 family protein [Bacillus sp. CGMCC 1.60114]|uniref:YIP1 family protein n=1 Tax=unclassified Bacillus (in: firmicutes) TaxID=185979 RepID=UPI0036266412